MRDIRSLTSALVLALAVAVTGCSDLPFTPEAPAQESTLANLSATDVLWLQDKMGDDFELVTVVRRSVPLLEDESVTMVIGPAGGEIKLQLAGLKFKVDEGALTEDVSITITAPAGDLVGYFFEPHGLQFLEPVKTIQDRKLLDLPKKYRKVTMNAAYFTGPLLPEVETNETLPIQFKAGTLEFYISHFSGYVIATD